MQWQVVENVTNVMNGLVFHVSHLAVTLYASIVLPHLLPVVQLIAALTILLWKGSMQNLDFLTIQTQNGLCRCAWSGKHPLTQNIFPSASSLNSHFVLYLLPDTRYQPALTQGEWTGNSFFTTVSSKVRYLIEELKRIRSRFYVIKEKKESASTPKSDIDINGVTDVEEMESNIEAESTTEEEEIVGYRQKPQNCGGATHSERFKVIVFSQFAEHLRLIEEILLSEFGEDAIAR